MSQTTPTADTIRARRTTKMLADQPLPVRDCRAQVDELIAAAGWAPFHRPCDKTHQRADAAGIEPWRLYALDAPACRLLREQLIDAGDSSKVPRMLAAADALVLATWLPNPPRKDQVDQPHDRGGLFDPTLENMEHLAAASAAVQNLLLAATERGIANYWSSGGALRSDATFEQLSIPTTELLLGAVFLFPSASDGVQINPSKLRDQRTPAAQWSRWIGG